MFVCVCVFVCALVGGEKKEDKFNSAVVVVVVAVGVDATLDLLVCL